MLQKLFKFLIKKPESHTVNLVQSLVNSGDHL